jgi:hypothetical protein
MKNIELKIFTFTIPLLLGFTILIAKEIINLDTNIYLFILLNLISFYFTPYLMFRNENLLSRKILVFSNLIISIICSFVSIKLLLNFSNNIIESTIIIIYSIFVYYLLYNRKNINQDLFIYFHMITLFFSIGAFKIL